MAFVSFRRAFTWAMISVVTFLTMVYELPLKDEELKGKVVVVTGASTGIGEQIAYHYARHGAQVYLVARRKDVLNQVAKKCLALGAKKAVVHSADMGKPEDIAGTFKDFSSNFKTLDHLVINHKIENKLGLWTGDENNITNLENVMNVDFVGYVRLASAFLPLLEKSNGSIGVLSSMAGRINTLYLLPYSAAKHALDGFFGGLRLELEAKNSNVSITFCVLGLIDTDNAIKELKTLGFPNLSRLGAASANDTAHAVVTAVTRKRRELYYPWLATRIPLIFRYVSPKVFDAAGAFFLRAGEVLEGPKV
ncbi:hypothetical protein RvY_04960 [Ramazzottius varieornatus]|uniref:Hydroxysteroid 11-beta-dehydrogenase 1-like protein n=1 Tax=Ramazzottius varieornatus TaxID=947166 RepID=A0A1D1UWK4_RAMVA|nr:hypothetical protein RvY_04960 [Ramazzottius varieornatus]